MTIAVPPNKTVMKVREKCYAGALRDTPMVKKDGTNTESCIPRITDSYQSRGNLRTLTVGKLSHLKQMYANFIVEEMWLDFNKCAWLIPFIVCSPIIDKTSSVYGTSM